MSDEYGIGTALGSVLVMILGWTGYELRKVNKEIQAFSEKYVMKEDYRDDMKGLKEELRAMRTDASTGAESMRAEVKHGLERIHDRIDAKHE